VLTKPAMAKYLLQYPHLSDWEKSIKEVEVHIGLQCHLRRRREDTLIYVLTEEDHENCTRNSQSKDQDLNPGSHAHGT